MDYEVIDNFLPPEIFERYSFLLGSRMPMFYSEGVSSKEDDNEFYWYHSFYNQNLPSSEFYQDFTFPLLAMVKSKAVISSRANWFPRTHEIIEHGAHVDSTFPHRNIVFYINTNNGFTRLYDDDGDSIVVNSVANRALLFDGLIRHNSTTCSDQKVRCTMAVNYFA